MNSGLVHKGIRSSGFSLVEMMVAMVIGLIAVGAVSMVYLSSSKTAKFQSAVLRIQENGRFAVDLMSRSIRMAGYRDPKVVEEIIANQAADLLGLGETGDAASITLSQALFPGGWLRGTRSFQDAILTYPGLKPDVDTIGFTFQGGDNIYDCQGRLVTADEFVTNMFAVSEANDLLCVTSAVVDSGDYCTDDGSGGSGGDSGSSDSGSSDSGSSDSGSSDSGSSDSGSSDSGSSDSDDGSGGSDSGSSDSGSSDSGSSDSGSSSSDDGSGSSGGGSSGCKATEGYGSGTEDSGSEDSGSSDSGSSDSGSSDSDNDDSGSSDSGSEDSGSSDSGSEDSGSDESSDSGSGSSGGSVTGSGGLPGVSAVAGGAVAIVEGVEDLKVYYGIDLNADGFANQYLRANEVPDWDKVVGLRLVVLMDSVENVLANKDKICLGCIEYKGTTDNKIRAEFQAMVSVRNFVEETTSTSSGSGGSGGDTGSDDGGSSDSGSSDSGSSDAGGDDSGDDDGGDDPYCHGHGHSHSHGHG